MQREHFKRFIPHCCSSALVWRGNLDIFVMLKQNEAEHLLKEQNSDLTGINFGKLI